MKFLILSLILSSQALFAANAPTKINLIPLESQFITIETKDQAVVLNNVNKSIKEISGGILDLPASISIIVPQNYDSPFFDPLALTLVAPYQMVINGRSKNPVFTRGVELHEFGHAIFNENLEYILAKHPELKNQWVAAKKVINKISADKSKLLKKDLVLELLQRKIAKEKPAADSAIFAEVQKFELSLNPELDKLNRVLSTNEAILNDIIQIIQSLTPYNEFFADVVSIAITQNPQSVADALHFSNDKDIPYEDRSFERRASRRPQDGSPHNFYSLSRNYIYKYYLSNPIYKAKGKAFLIRKTLDAVVCGINTQNELVQKLTLQAEALVAKNPRFNVERFFVEKLNDGLNSCMDQVF